MNVRVRKCAPRAHSHPQRVFIGSLFALCATACAEIGSSPSEAAAIEFNPLPAPSIVLGDSLRNIDGLATPIHATVRNVRGDVIAEAPVRYLYADASRDTSIAVDSVSGHVFATKATNPATATARLAARMGSVLQVLSSIVVTSRPDSADRNGVTTIATLTTTRPDTSRTSARANTSVPLTVVVRHVDNSGSTPAVNPVNAWLVKFELLQPTNAANDSTQSVFLVDEGGRASTVDTTDASGQASRSVRVRATQFPSGTAVDSVIVRANITYKGQSVKGAPIRLALPVRQGSGS